MSTSAISFNEGGQRVSGSCSGYCSSWDLKCDNRNVEEVIKNRLKEYLKYDYPVRIVREPDGMYCAEVDDVKGLCAYGKTPADALKELEGVKEVAFELMLSQGQEPPVPKVKLEIPENVFRKIRDRRLLKQYVKV